MAKTYKFANANISMNVRVTLRSITRDQESAYTSTLSSTVTNLHTTPGQIMFPKPFPLYAMVLLAIVLAVIILVTLIGNVFVIIACYMDRNLKRPQYYLIVSLAVADLLVGVTVMTFSAFYEVQHYRWTIGQVFCDIWTSVDVLCCSASILHLVAIALDRYWSITDVVYVQNRTPKRISLMIVVIWSLAFVISVGPILGWKDADYGERLEHLQCLISQDVGYQIFAATTTFYLPLGMVIVLYYKIFMAAKNRIHRRHEQKGSHLLQALKRVAHTGLSASPNHRQKKSESGMTQLCSASETMNSLNQDQEMPISKDLSNLSSQISADAGNSMGSSSAADIAGSSDRLQHIAAEENSDQDKTTVGISKKLRKKQLSMETKRERKAARTLAIVTGVFVFCWLPFFILALIRPLCKHQCNWNPEIDSLSLWLGYVNSMLNPVIYTIFSPDFRAAFRNILSKSMFRA